MIKMMCGVGLVHGVLTDVLWDRVGVVAKIEDNVKSTMVLWSCHLRRHQFPNT